MHYYGDNDPFTVAWQERLVADGRVPRGLAVCRDIRDLKPGEVDDYEQVHLFGGILGWPRALELAGWPRGRRVWTGSAPCQPFSRTGKKRGHRDDRHLWPVFFELIRHCRPPTILGEQVASPLGREWFAGVRLDLEALGYACGAVDIPAAGVGAPHNRPRIYWCATRLGDPDNQGFEGRNPEVHKQRTGELLAGTAGFLADVRSWDEGCEWVPCTDGAERKFKPGIHPLADGVPNRVGLIRGGGNAIVPQLGAAFVRAFLLAELDVRDPSGIQVGDK